MTVPSSHHTQIERELGSPRKLDLRGVLPACVCRALGEHGMPHLSPLSLLFPSNIEVVWQPSPPDSVALWAWQCWLHRTEPSASWAQVRFGAPPIQKGRVGVGQMTQLDPSAQELWVGPSCPCACGRKDTRGRLVSGTRGEWDSLGPSPPFSRVPTLTSFQNLAAT